jgi:hypothetical protein
MEVVGLGKGGIMEARLEDYIVSDLVDFDDVAYDNHADLLYDLATQTVQHFRAYLPEEECYGSIRGILPTSSTFRCRSTIGKRQLITR